MRKIALLVALVLGMWTMGGCATLTHSHDQTVNQYKRVGSIQMRELIHDWNYMWLADRPSRLSYELVR